MPRKKRSKTKFVDFGLQDDAFFESSQARLVDWKNISDTIQKYDETLFTRLMMCFGGARYSVLVSSKEASIFAERMSKYVKG